MRKLYASLLFASLLVVATSAHADPLRPKAPAANAPLATFGWTGFYLGGHAGYGWGTRAFHTSFADTLTALWWKNAILAGAYDTAPTVDARGWSAGLQLGYNYRLDRHIIGLEADMSRAGIDGTHATALQVGTYVPSMTVAGSNLDWFATLRVRFGFLPSDKLLIYTTSGFAFGRVSHSYDFAFPNSNDFVAGRSDRKIEWGWTFGGGAELAIAARWTAKFEYLYYDLGDTTFQTTGSGASSGRGTFNVTTENSGHIVRIGLNYRL